MEVEKLYNVVKPMNQPKRRQRLHIHLFPAHQAKSTQSRTGRVPSLYSHDDPELGVKEALAILENQSYMPSPVSLWQRVDAVNQFLKTDQSVYAFKTAAISSVFLVLCKNCRTNHIVLFLTYSILPPFYSPINSLPLYASGIPLKLSRTSD